jgi:hypothetical protein
MKRFDHVLGFIRNLGVTETEGGQARGGVLLVAGPVPGLLGGGPVIPESVRLDHQSELWPVEVDPEAVDPLLGQGPWQRCASYEA